MNTHIKKMIAPIIITILFLLYQTLYGWAVVEAANAAHGAKKASDAKKKSDDSKKADKEKASKGRKKKVPVLYIESLLGGTITAEEVLKRIPDCAEEVYVKPEKNKAYWVKGKKTGTIDLW